MRTLFDLFDTQPPLDSTSQLNEAQRRAISHRDGPLLVIAGAGTGKTRVITERIRHLLESDPSLSGENILGLTFTDKAAGEMKARVVRAVGERAKDVTLKTFHAFCESLLKDTDPKSRMLEGGSLDFAAAESFAAATRPLSASRRAGTIPERLRRVFLALPG